VVEKNKIQKNNMLKRAQALFSRLKMPKIGDMIILSCQGKNFDKKMNATIIDIKKNGWLRVIREDGYKLNIRNGKNIIYSEKKPMCREKTRQVFEIVRDTLLEAQGGDQDALTSGKFIRNLIENHFK
tara:strand:- start:1347 stop:1727 length:381 start_codon:yes stop_codon:yes gene_type:complete